MVSTHDRAKILAQNGGGNFGKNAGALVPSFLPAYLTRRMSQSAQVAFLVQAYNVIRSTVPGPAKLIRWAISTSSWGAQ